MLSRLTSKIFSSFSKKKSKMEVTKTNFAEKLPLIEAAIRDAEFISIDGEFTGLHEDGGRNSALDTPAERYEKKRRSVNKFLIVQFGMCTFHYDQQKDQYTNRAFNFYVWPKPYSRLAPDLRFMCQTSSIDFLISNDFDFNKLFKDGIPYLRPGDEARLRETISDRQESRRSTGNFATPNFGTTAIPEEQKEFMNGIFEKVDKWLKNAKPDEKLMLDSCNPFQRRLIYSNVKPRFSDEHSCHMETVIDPNNKHGRCIQITKMDAEEQRKVEADRDKLEFDDLDSAVGFAKVIKKISESRKPVIGHNMFLDLCHTLQQFVAPLPEDYDEFKALTNSTFPKIIDTKLMATTSPLREEIFKASLDELLKTVSQTPFKLPQVESAKDHTGYEMGDKVVQKYHEAGYDAFITGLCFIAMSNRLGALSPHKLDKENVLANDKLLLPFMNKVNLINIIDIPYMDLSGPDIVPDRDHVFHVSFPPEWKTTDLTQLFLPFGSVLVTWKDDSSAFVSLREHVPNAKAVVMSTLNCSSIYRIVPYAIHKKMEETYKKELNTGITPMLEKANVFQVLKPNDSKKRPAPVPEENVKRSKSETDDGPKIFDDVNWD